MSQAEGQRLDSWKEIAAYLGRDLSTVRRWERDKKLPVHRVPGGDRRSVFAYRDQIDAWLKGLEDSQDIPAQAENPEFSPSTTVANDRGLALAASATESGAPPRMRHAAFWITAVALLALLICALWLPRKLHSNPPTQFALAGSSLVASDATRATLWAYDFHQPLNSNPAGFVGPRVGIFELGPDRRKDVLVAAPRISDSAESSHSDAIYSFSADGNLQWQHTFNDVFRFGGQDYGLPWYSNPLMVLSEKNASSIWASAGEYFWSPSTLIKFDRDGHVLGQFVNWGHITSLNHVYKLSGSYILVGGISNQCNCAMLAVLSADHPSGSSPALPGSTSVCENCPAGSPLRYLLFPRSELTELSGAAYNKVSVIHVDGSQVWIAVSETSGPGDPPGADWEKFELSDDFIPTSFTVSDHYWTLHHEMEAEGKIHHSLEHCPERGAARESECGLRRSGGKR